MTDPDDDSTPLTREERDNLRASIIDTLDILTDIRDEFRALGPDATIQQAIDFFFERLHFMDNWKGE